MAYEDYTLVQIRINAVDGLLPARAFYPVGLNGKYKAHLIGISFADRAENAELNKLIQISSDCFRGIKGNMLSSIAFASFSRHNLANPQGHYPFILDAVGGNIDLTLTSSQPYNGTPPNAFDFAILTLKVCPMP
jgi:hypothetical protein